MDFKPTSIEQMEKRNNFKHASIFISSHNIKFKFKYLKK